MNEADIILVAGASGYIGRRLVRDLLAQGRRVRAMVPRQAELYKGLWPGAEVVEADARDRGRLGVALKDVTAAYYLIHSIHFRPAGYESDDILAARNFREEAETRGVSRIIYLGGLADLRCGPGSNLGLRRQVAEELGRGGPLLTELRAAVIIGSGSAAFEMYNSVAGRLPVVPMPPWGTNLCQPISLRDTVDYLIAVLDDPGTEGNRYEIGGPDILRYEEMLEVLMRRARRRGRIVHIPITSTRFYSYAASLITPVPYPLAKALIEGFRNELVCRGDFPAERLQVEPMTYEAAVDRAYSREAEHLVFSRWSDAYPVSRNRAIRLSELGSGVAFTSSYSRLSEKAPAVLYGTITRIGGERGWFSTSWMWRARGLVDRLAKGVGTSRGRKSLADLRVDDVIDFWRVEELVEDHKVLLRAEMKLPGLAWLEFDITPENGKSRLSVSALYDTDRLGGRLYWYLLLPFHRRLFRKLLEDIDRES